MSTDPNAESPWTRPGFLASSGVIALIIVLGVLLVVTSLGSDGRRDQVNTSRPDGIARPGRRSTSAGSASICGLPGLETRVGDLDLGTTTWRYGSAAGYPTSPRYGPGRASQDGFRYCFQHSVGGALFAAANSLAFDNTGLDAARAWSRYILADGPYRKQRLAEPYVPNDSDVRLQIAGFRIISYDQHEARIDTAVRTTTLDEIMIVSVQTHLVWQRGDWRLSTGEPESVTVARIPDLTGYTPWAGA